MKFIFSKKGTSQTEYVIIIVLIAMSVMFAVGKYGKEIKSLFKKTNNRLTLLDGSDNIEPDTDNSSNSGVSEGEDSGGLIGYDDENEDSSEGSLEKPEEDNIHEGKSKEECQKEYQNLLNERNQEENLYNQRCNYFRNRINYFQNLANYYTNLANKYRNSWYWGWSWGGFFQRHRRTSSLYSRYMGLAGSYRNRAHGMSLRLNNEIERHNKFLEKWNLKMSKWQKECGNSP